LALGAALCGCGDGAPLRPAPPVPDREPPTARLDLVRGLRADIDAVRHPSDGQGRAWLEQDGGAEPTAVVRARGAWTLVYEAGPLGIAPGGTVVLTAGPYWNWSTPQTEDPEFPGYTTVECDAAGAELEARAFDRFTLGIQVRGDGLEAGARVRIAYGCGPAGAKADDFAERGSCFWFRVDGDGDGVGALVVDSPRIDVEPGPAARLLAFLPATARVGETVELAVALVDAYGDRAEGFRGVVELTTLPEELRGAERVELGPQERGAARVALQVLGEGALSVRARALADGTDPTGGGAHLRAESSPMFVDGGPRILWGDLHGHTNLSDGTGLPRDYFDYARDVARLDFAALTDHDHWGMRYLDQNPELWREILSATEAAHEPGRFASIPGYEWTSWIHGHRHVLYFADASAAESAAESIGALPLYSSMEPDSKDPSQLWSLLRGRPALTLAHHSAGGPIATNWTYAPDPELEPVTEIVSVHGSSEALDSPRRIYQPLPGNFVRDALELGYVLGFVGSGDSHDGHPGLPQLAGACGGLAAVMSEELSRPALREALGRRACYATSGARIVLRATLGGAPMGSAVSADGLGERAWIELAVAAPEPVARVDLVRGLSVVESRPGDGSRSVALELEVAAPRPGEFVYVRVVQVDDHFACTSPWFIE
jgi:hypothetical protein